MSAIVGTPESEVNGNRSHELPGLFTKTEMTQPRHIPAACSLSFFPSMVMDYSVSEYYGTVLIDT